jgi:hypothetical protein
MIILERALERALEKVTILADVRFVRCRCHVPKLAFLLLESLTAHPNATKWCSVT